MQSYRFSIILIYKYILGNVCSVSDVWKIMQVEKSAVITQAKNASNAADAEFCSFSKSEEIKKLKEKIENARNETKASNMKVDEMKLKATKLSEEYERFILFNLEVFKL